MGRFLPPFTPFVRCHVGGTFYVKVQPTQPTQQPCLLGRKIDSDWGEGTEADLSSCLRRRDREAGRIGMIGPVGQDDVNLGKDSMQIS